MKILSNVILLAVILLPIQISNCLAQAAVTLFNGVSFTYYQIDLESTKLVLLSKDDNGVRLRNAGELELRAKRSGKSLKFATNSGIFDSRFNSLGLHVEAGKQITSLNTGEGDGNFYLKPNGVFYVKGSQASVVPTEKFDNGLTVDYATQSGPLLLDQGIINSKFNPNSVNKLIRSGVGVKLGSIVIFAISDDPVTFYEFATFFRDHLKCRSALYLDGVISKMYAADLNRLQKSGDFAAMFVVFGDGNVGE